MTDLGLPDPAAPDRPDRRSLIGLVLLALVIRVGMLAATPDALAADPDAYRAVARNLIAYGCFGNGDRPTATRPLLYPLLVAGGLWMDPDGVVALATTHVVLGVATVLLTYLLALRWGLGRWSLAAAALVAVDPILLAQSTLVMTETLATFLAVASLLALTRCAQKPSPRRAAAAGAMVALAVLCRPTFLLWMGASIVMLPCFGALWPQRARLLAAMVLAAAVFLGPWTIRNALHFGKPTPATNHGGFTLLLANNPSFYEYLRTASRGEIWDADQFNLEWATRSRRLTGGDEVAADRLAYADARRTIGSQPRMFAYACLVRLGRTWGVLPHRVDPAAESPRRLAARWAVAAFYSAEFLFALAGLAALASVQTLRGRLATGWLWGLVLVATVTATHTFFWTNMRMRAPLVPVVAIAAAAGAALLAGSAARRKSLKR